MTDNLFRNKFLIPSTRLAGYDYSQTGYYFITICTKNKFCYFGEIVGDEIVLNDIGKMATKYWLEIPKHFPFVTLDEFVIMPNHVHGIIIINNNPPIVETQNFASLHDNDKLYHNKFGPQSKNLSSIIRGFKIGVSKWATTNNVSFIWQARFYDHIIRDEISLHNIQQYIFNNPSMWDRDRNNPEGLLV
ncbi:MAG: hypothetical protein US42_C0005G0037 [Candidatus Magasanikbacteria bacterium GW2011_GWC2_37_14]|uniref:Transposase IS200-like domain-containing protein n=1 Tax=Candidatus Magasanikbacteria bacterium GW2011_GWC2_37_14 TaxID=1619046 RepID=A0A0G0GCV8_9BACT|nr:MAG: hypothetical protein US42_C0005G0037 [Candidatus Magasanikbacteria bacterium GW2011_GWC2_37_14]